MERKEFLISTLLIFALPLIDSPSWIGIQGLDWQSEQTATATYMGVSSTSSGSDEGFDLIISGSLYPESNYGLGFQFGTTKENTPTDSDTPWAWRGVLTSLYIASISEFLALEFGTGLLFE